MAAEIKDAKVEMAAGFNKVDKRFERLEAREKERERQYLALMVLFKNCASKK